METKTNKTISKVYINIDELDKLTNLLTNVWSDPHRIARMLLDDLNLSDADTKERFTYWSMYSLKGPQLHNWSCSSHVKMLWAAKWLDMKAHSIERYGHITYIETDPYDNTVIYDHEQKIFTIGTIADLPNFELSEFGKNDNKL
jgi:hypothetical protein